jgi:N-acyl-phosphatidylethanolamine-hydrolysing phospholipase D
VQEEYMPTVHQNLLQRISQLPAVRDFLVWIGHASFVIRLDGEYWITDPMLSKRALLPKRKIPPALSIAELAALPAPLNVIISYNHY